MRRVGTDFPLHGTGQQGDAVGLPDGRDTSGGRPVAEQVVRVGVHVTFLRMENPPAEPPPAWPQAVSLVRLAAPSVAFYRYLYATVGGAHVWWLRRTAPDQEIASLLADPAVAIHVLYLGGEPAGFFELDARGALDVNIGYFGLMPWAVGRGLGFPFLRAAVDAAWAQGPRAVMVNTCTADHPRALPNYLRAGFVPLRRMREIWDVPVRLGLVIPEALVVK